MKTLHLSILLSLALTGYCAPLFEEEDQDESLAEVCILMSALNLLNFQVLLERNVLVKWVQLTNWSSLLQNYLKRFYNLTEETGAVFRTGLSLKEQKLAEMQRFFHLQVTRTLDSDTIAMMKKPRCGVPDIQPSGYSITGHAFKWRTNSLTYRWLDESISFAV